MKFIIICDKDPYEGAGYKFVEADTPLDAIREYVSECIYTGEDKSAFAILCTCGTMELTEIVAFANNHFLSTYAAITGMYCIGEQII